MSFFLSVVLDLDRLLEFPFWTRFGFTLSTGLLFFFLAGFGFGRASGLRFLDMIRDHVEPSTFVFCFLWIDLDRSLASVCGFFREAGFDCLASLASRPCLGGAPSHEACYVISLRSMALGHCTPPLGPPQIQKGVNQAWLRGRLISPSLDRK